MTKRSGQTLIAALIVIAIILILVVVFFHPTSTSPRKDKKGFTTMGLARLSALDLKCQSDLQQIRLAIQTAHDSDPDGSYPPDLESTKLGAEFYTCPVGGEKYVYDPKTGEVHCPHPGHEKY